MAGPEVIRDSPPIPRSTPVAAATHRPAMRILDRWREWLKRHPRLAGAVAWLGRRRRRLTALFVVLAHVIGALTSVRAIMEVRTSQGAIAWAISLNTMPYVAVPAYWVFGRSDFKGYVTARRSHHAEVKEFWDEFHQSTARRRSTRSSRESSAPRTTCWCSSTSSTTTASDANSRSAC